MLHTHRHFGVLAVLYTAATRGTYAAVTPV